MIFVSLPEPHVDGHDLLDIVSCQFISGVWVNYLTSLRLHFIIRNTHHLVESQQSFIPENKYNLTIDKISTNNFIILFYMLFLQIGTHTPLQSK